MNNSTATNPVNTKPAPRSRKLNGHADERTSQPVATRTKLEQAMATARAQRDSAWETVRSVLPSGNTVRFVCELIANFAVGYGIASLLVPVVEAISLAVLLLTASGVLSMLVWALGVVLCIVALMRISPYTGAVITKAFDFGIAGARSVGRGVGAMFKRDPHANLKANAAAARAKGFGNA